MAFSMATSTTAGSTHPIAKPTTIANWMEHPICVVGITPTSDTTTSVHLPPP
jgi:hypothetical protein